jgi:hypothetical protein
MAPAEQAEMVAEQAEAAAEHVEAAAEHVEMAPPAVAKVAAPLVHGSATWFMPYEEFLALKGKKPMTAIAADTELVAPEPATEETVAMSVEEKHVLRWFRESQRSARGAACAQRFGNDEYEWVDMPVGPDAVTVEISQERMHEIGLVTVDGKTPTDEEPAKLFWIQDKPAAHKNKFGHWDPVGAQWCMYPGHTIVPVEQRIGPMGKGYGGTADGTRLHSAEPLCTFGTAELADATPYVGTALETAVPHIVSQIEALGPATQVPVISGWGSGQDGAVAYYTPQLRHLALDTDVAAEAGKKYLYKWRGDPVKPVEGAAVWDGTNTCWIYGHNGGATGNQAPCCTGYSACSERAKDNAMMA